MNQKRSSPTHMEAQTKKSKVHTHCSSHPDYKDDWSTPKHAYKDIRNSVEHYQKTQNIQKLVIWDPFYNASSSGTAGKYLQEVFPDATIIHGDQWVDLSDTIIPDYAKDVNLIVTNPPYSGKHKLTTTMWMMSLNIPFMTLIPHDTDALKCFRPIIRNFQKIVPNGRITFESGEGEKSKSSPRATAWFCYGCNLPYQTVYLD